MNRWRGHVYKGQRHEHQNVLIAPWWRKPLPVHLADVAWAKLNKYMSYFFPKIGPACGDTTSKMTALVYGIFGLHLCAVGSGGGALSLYVKR